MPAQSTAPWPNQRCKTPKTKQPTKWRGSLIWPPTQFATSQAKRRISLVAQLNRVAKPEKEARTCRQYQRRGRQICEGSANGDVGGGLRSWAPFGSVDSEFQWPRRNTSSPDSAVSTCGARSSPSEAWGGTYGLPESQGDDRHRLEIEEGNWKQITGKVKEQWG